MTDDWPSEDNTPSDRRQARGVRTRHELTESMIELIHAESAMPTTREVADRAGVSVRILFYHFHLVDVLFHSAAVLEVSRLRKLIAVLPPNGPVGLRIQAICRQRRQLFEALAPMRRAASSRAVGSSDLDDVLAPLVSLLREQLTVTLGPEIFSRASDSQMLLQTAILVTSEQNWLSLRVQGGHSATAAERIVVHWVTSLLD